MKKLLAIVKLTSHILAKHLLNIVVLISMTCAGSRNDQMTLSRFMAQKGLRKRTPKWGPKFAAKTGALIKGLLCALTKALTHDLPTALLIMRYPAPTKEIQLSRDKAGIRKLLDNASPKIVKHVAGGGPHFGVQKVDPKIGFLD